HNRTTAIVSIVRITLVALLVVVGTLTVSILTCKKKSKLVQTVYEVPPPQVSSKFFLVGTQPWISTLNSGTNSSGTFQNKVH
ncbi:hypothetical protein GOODEAATRI_029661, partial [Goodea atripinnis]